MNQPSDPINQPHDNQAHLLIGSVIAVVIVASLAVGLRIYTRAYMLERFGADDYLAVLSLLLVVATGVSQCINTTNGLGTHSWDLESHDKVIAYLKNFYVSIVFYNATLMLIKMTFMVQYYRVLVLKKFRTVCTVVMTIVGAWSLSQLIIAIFLCKPIAGFWDASLNATCIPIPLQWYINAGGNIATDIIIFILPLPILTHLELPKMQKISLVGIFSLGFFTCALSVIRIKFLNIGSDFTYDNIEASIWSITELCSGVTCASLITLRPFVSNYIPKLASTFQKSSIRCLRHFGFQVADPSGERKRKREIWNENNGTRYGSEHGFLPHGARVDTSHEISGDILDSFTTLQTRTESIGRGSVVSLSAPKPTHIRPQNRTRPNTHLGWGCSSVTTTITADNRDSWISYEIPSAIHVTRDIRLQNIPPFDS
ncbi:hypothetical protein F5Y09DRAFT_184018 [Xylaria sp. FL1042]|nr:hypothetical protein F5Y09DRAFT_184018 [Xylaria sp. FL1042]